MKAALGAGIRRVVTGRHSTSPSFFVLSSTFVVRRLACSEDHALSAILRGRED